MDKYLEKAEKSGLLNVITDWIKTEKYISTSKIQREFSVGFNTATAIFNKLIEDGLVEEKPTYDKGHRVIHFSLGMDIYLLDTNKNMVKAWNKAFKEDKEIKVVEDNFIHFMNTNDVKCIVSPANSYGIMNGGYDLAIIDYFGESLQKEVQKKIKQDFYGEQPIGTAISVNIPGSKTNQVLIHVPTMQTPKPVKDDNIVYQCMRVALMEALKLKVKSIAIPAFGGGTGNLSANVIAKRMEEAYEQIISNL